MKLISRSPNAYIIAAMALVSATAFGCSSDAADTSGAPAATDTIPGVNPSAHPSPTANPSPANPSPANPSPANVSPTSPAPAATSDCASMDFWTGGDRESPLMHPGNACVECHTARGEGPTFAIAGTLYTNPHEVDDCNGIDASYAAQVVITDAQGTEFKLNMNAAGNFMYEGNDLVVPYQAKVVYSGQERVMFSPQTNGDCNSCHTKDGSLGAPGRIQLP